MNLYRMIPISCPHCGGNLPIWNYIRSENTIEEGNVINDYSCSFCNGYIQVLTSSDIIVTPQKNVYEDTTIPVSKSFTMETILTESNIFQQMESTQEQNSHGELINTADVEVKIELDDIKENPRPNSNTDSENSYTSFTFRDKNKNSQGEIDKVNNKKIDDDSLSNKTESKIISEKSDVEKTNLMKSRSDNTLSKNNAKCSSSNQTSNKYLIENTALFVILAIVSLIPILNTASLVIGAVGLIKGEKKVKTRGAILVVIVIIIWGIVLNFSGEIDKQNIQTNTQAEVVSTQEVSEEPLIDEITEDAEIPVDSNQNSSENEDTRADWAKEKLPYPNESEIIQIENINDLYERFSQADEDKWYEFEGIVYLIDDTSVSFHHELDSILGIIQLEFADSSQLEGIKKGDSIRVVAHSYMKVTSFLMMNSVYVKDTSKTAYSADSETVYIVDDYVDFWKTYEQSNMGIKVQVTVPLDEIDNNRIFVRTGLDSGISSMIDIELADGESTMQLRQGDMITVYGTCGAKVLNTASINDAHIGEATCETKPYSEVIFYKEKNGESTEEDVSLVNENVTYENVTANTMIQELRDNALNAKNKYQDSYVEVSGVVCNIDASGKYFTIDNGETFEMYRIQCFTRNDAQKADLSRLSVGKKTTVKGKITMVGEILGYSLDIDEIQ